MGLTELTTFLFELVMLLSLGQKVFLTLSELLDLFKELLLCKKTIHRTCAYTDQHCNYYFYLGVNMFTLNYPLALSLKC